MSAKGAYVAVGLAGLIVTVAGVTAWSISSPPAVHGSVTGWKTGVGAKLDDVAGLPGWAERFARNPNAATGNDREQRELAAQESAQLWSFWALIIGTFQSLLSLIGFAALIVTLRQGYRNLDNSDKSISLSREMAQLELRAYINVTFDTTKVEGDRRTDFNVVFENSGNTPAKNFQVFLRQSKIRGRYEDYNFDLEAVPFAGSKGWLGAGQKGTMERRLILKESEKLAFRKAELTVVVWGKARYEDVFGNSHSLIFRKKMKSNSFGRFINTPSGNFST